MTTRDKLECFKEVWKNMFQISEEENAIFDQENDRVN